MTPFRRISRTWDLVVRQLWRTGLIQSIWRQRPSTPTDLPLPWWSLSAIDFLGRLSVTHRVIVEFGSGNSTLWWAKRHRYDGFSYRSFEPDFQYWQKMRKESYFYEQHVICYAHQASYVTMLEHMIDGSHPAVSTHTRPDIVIVDGPIHLREKEVSAALALLVSHGLLVIDDANWISDSVHSQLRTAGFVRLDLWGPSPGCSYTKLTTLYSRNFNYWLSDMHPIGTPVGGLDKFPGMG